MRKTPHRLRRPSQRNSPFHIVGHVHGYCPRGMPDRQRREIIRSRGPVALPVQGAPVLHEIIPGGSSRIWFCESDATMGGTNGENPQGTTKRADSGTYFELHFAMLRVLAAKDPRLCVHFLYRGESPGFFELSAQNRGLVAAMAIKAA